MRNFIVCEPKFILSLLLVTTIADLKTSLEFSQKDIEKHKTQITLLDMTLQSAVEEITKRSNIVTQT